MFLRGKIAEYCFDPSLTAVNANPAAKAVALLRVAFQRPAKAGQCNKIRRRRHDDHDICILGIDLGCGE